MWSILLTIVVFLPCQAAPSPKEKSTTCPTISDVATDASSLIRKSGQWMWRNVKSWYHKCEKIFVGEDGFFTTLYFNSTNNNKPPKPENSPRKCCNCRCKQDQHQQNDGVSQLSDPSTQTDKLTGTTSNTRDHLAKACGITALGCACDRAVNDSAKGSDPASSQNNCNCSETCKSVCSTCGQVTEQCLKEGAIWCIETLEKSTESIKDSWSDCDGQKCAQCCMKTYCRVCCCCWICELFGSMGGSGGSGTAAGGGGTTCPF